MELYHTHVLIAMIVSTFDAGRDHTHGIDVTCWILHFTLVSIVTGIIIIHD